MVKYNGTGYYIKPNPNPVIGESNWVKLGFLWDLFVLVILAFFLNISGKNIYLGWVDRPCTALFAPHEKWPDNSAPLWPLAV